jgi:adenylate kinase family enzyme
MRRVAVFGNAGGGKSTLARQLAAITGLPLYIVDKTQWQDGGAAVPHDVYLNLHRDLMAKEVWIIEGYGDTATVLDRCSVADTLIHVDLPLPIHYWWVTKRLIMGLFADPAGWPRGSPLWSSTMLGYRVIPQCHKYLTPRYRQLILEMATSKFVVHLRSPREIRAFLDKVRSELTH